jgi:Ca2+-binding RTX toxin-like protein
MVLTDFVAPYSGSYYVMSIWDKSSSDKSGYLIVGEDLDTAARSNHLPTGEITISGTAKQDENLTVANTLADEDGLGDYEYQWLSNGVEITDATLETYKVSAGDIGKTISVKISYIDGEGTLESVASSATAIVTGKSATAGNDLLIGTKGSDKISGLAGNDTLVGGLGKDTLTGDSGADIFKFSAINETGKTSATRDVITDFKHNEGDKMDLSSIDANSKLAGDQAFKFIGSKSFSGSAGEVRFDSVNKILYGNVNSDKTPDFAIQLNGVKSLVIDDFVL